MAKYDVWTGLAAGVAGGLAAAYVMGRVAARGARGGGPDATALAADAVALAVTGRELTGAQKEIGGQVVHYAFGAAMGGAYGALSAALPQTAAGYGVPFGAAVYLGAHGLAVPRLGLADSPLDRPLAVEATELAAHVVYGVVADLVRRGVLALERLTCTARNS